MPIYKGLGGVMATPTRSSLMGNKPMDSCFFPILKDRGGVMATPTRSSLVGNQRMDSCILALFRAHSLLYVSTYFVYVDDFLVVEVANFLQIS